MTYLIEQDLKDQFERETEMTWKDNLTTIYDYIHWLEEKVLSTSPVEVTDEEIEMAALDILPGDNLEAFTYIQGWQAGAIAMRDGKIKKQQP